MIGFSGAKINIGLNVTAKRTDGYHNLESIFFPIGIYDIIEVNELNSGKEKFSLSCSGLSVPGLAEDNLIYKAWEKLQTIRTLPMVKVHLHKVNPMGAGLGAGSANAVVFLQLMDKTFSLNLSPTELFNATLSLGSDCPFFLKNTPQFCTGRGEIMNDVMLNLKGLFLCIAKPAIHVSTREAFAGIRPKPAQHSLVELISRPIEEWANNIVNDFEASLFPSYPQIERIKKDLYSNGALYASMSGSGSAVYGIFKTQPEFTLPGIEYFKVIAL